MKCNCKTVMMIAALLLFSPLAMQAQEVPPTINFTDSDFGIFKWIAGLMVIILVLLAWITVLLSVKDPAKFSLGYLMQSITGKNSADPLMEHKYDEIEELDNPVPLWLKLGFYGSIIFAVVYIFHYHVLSTGMLQEAEYNAELTEASLKYKDTELPPDKVTRLTDAASLAAAKAIFTETCAPCHGVNAQGTASAPNLTDLYWQNGNGTIIDIYSTITNGVPAKGMISWKSQISSRDRQALASYIMSVSGSNPAEAMPPYGKLITGDGSAAAPADSAATPAADSVKTDSAKVVAAPAGH